MVTSIPTGNGFILGLQSISPALSPNNSGLPVSFAADINGMFSAEPTPEPASLALLSMGLGHLLRRRRH